MSTNELARPAEATPSADPAGKLARGTWVALIGAVQTPLGFFVLLTLVVDATLAALLAVLKDTNQTILLIGALLLLFALLGAVFYLALVNDGSLHGRRRRRRGPLPAPDAERIERMVSENTGVFGADASPPSADVWDKEIRPVLHQAVHYTVPTYFLDTNLNVIDWNVAFELVFSRILGRILGKHVIHFIAALQNHDKVYDHAREFTECVRQGRLPLVDIEPLCYESEKYGLIRFVKVACQLHDPSARLRGWAVGLMVQDVDWESFNKDLLDKLTEDKLWSVYAASYDRVLSDYPAYKKLIQDVIAAVPAGGRKVADLGAGTGNVTAALLPLGHRVTALEKNAAMLERLRSKGFKPPAVTVVKASVENLQILKEQSFDAAVMMNVLYAVDDPLGCLRAVHRILKPNGVLSFSTTHSESCLDPLLNAIRQYVQTRPDFPQIEEDFNRLEQVNKHIEVTIARRHTRDEYCKWVRDAGFEITHYVPSTYADAVMLVHARKT